MSEKDNTARDSLVYFLFAQELQRIKIGATSLPAFRSRISDLQTGSPCHLRLVHFQITGGLTLERTLQRELLLYRFVNEWFCYCPAVFLAISRALGYDPLLKARFPTPILQDSDAQTICADNVKYGHRALKSKLLSGETLIL